MNKKMRIKILTGVLLAAVCFPPVMLGGIWIKALIFVIAAMAGYEIASLYEQKPDWIMTVLNTVFMFSGMFLDSIYIGVLITVWLVLLFCIDLFAEKNSDFAAYTFVLTTVCFMAMHCVRKIYTFSGGFYIMMFVLIACFMCDTMAYFCGVSFGKHKMIPKVSPNKTWEGAIGGYVCAAVSAIVFGLFLCKELPSALVITAGLLLPAAAEIGDLSFSSVKRRFAIKDFGNVFPGHGGVLDRVDSVIFCLMVFSGVLLVWGL